MESRAKVLGHGAHPILVALPIGLLTSSIGFDLLRLITGKKLWGQIAFWNIGAGCVGGWESSCSLRTTARSARSSSTCAVSAGWGSAPPSRARAGSSGSC